MGYTITWNEIEDRGYLIQKVRRQLSCASVIVRATRGVVSGWGKRRGKTYGEGRSAISYFRHG